MTARSAPAGYDGSEIAVVGMAGRFPGAPDLDTFWRNLEAGVESIASFTDDELRAAGEDPKLLEDPAYVRRRPLLEGVDLFDAPFFGFAPREAEVLDPQLRLFLECAWAAVESAGYDPERLPGRGCVFAGASFSDYLAHNLYHNRPVMESFGDFESTIYNVQDSLVTMAGYKLNLKGACCAVQTFCSTSLVGVHLACQNLLNYESDVALAGGVTVHVPQRSGYLFREGSILSRTGRCRTFDAGADGTVFGSGVGVVVLRRLADALEAGDPVRAVVRGSAVNNDGSLKVSFAAPGVVGQTEVIVEALSAAGVDPRTIGYVEAHGTATRLGDPAEVSALTKAFRTRTDARAFCGLGSVKSNVGHLDAAAGVAGLVKVILSLEHGLIPPTLHVEQVSPAIDFEASPFYVNTALREWPRGSEPRRAGVSAFGVGGTNAHVIVEEAPPAASEPSARAAQLLVLSAKTPSALAAAARQLALHLRERPQVPLADVAYTLQLGRTAFSHRTALVATSVDEAAALLAAAAESGPSLTVTEQRDPAVALVVQDLGAIAAGAWRDVYETEPAFAAALAECLAAAGEAGAAVRRTLFPPDRNGAGAESAAPATAPLAAFAVAYALARLLESWGVRFEARGGQG
ncbi:MAG TPA: beta-ketoacyl synthase N-terminal-like domain-containing protein [Vicinamibacteria bacterium]